jgi:uncharacterized membrane protein
MFEVSTSWINGLGQVITYAAVLLIILWVMSKINTKSRGGSSTLKENEREGK